MTYLNTVNTARVEHSLGYEPSAKEKKGKLGDYSFEILTTDNLSRALYAVSAGAFVLGMGSFGGMGTYCLRSPDNGNRQMNCDQAFVFTPALLALSAVTYRMAGYFERMSSN